MSSPFPVFLVMAHTLMGLPYMIRVLSTSFQTIPQDVIDAAENLGAGAWTKIREKESSS